MTELKNIIPDYDLLAKYFAGEASVTQIKAIEKWVAKNPAHKKTYDSMHFLWMQAAKTELEKKVNVNDAWTKMQFRMNAAKQAPIVVQKEVSIYRKTTYRLLQFAAIIIIALGVNLLIRYLNSDEKYVSTEAQLSSVNITLPDNSEIKLNKESKISYPVKFKGKERHIKLQGEAFFEVTPDKKKPFVVEAQFAQIKVLGTSFNVQAYDTSKVVEVTVVSGTVELSGLTAGSEKILLTKGEKGIISKDSGKAIKDTNTDEEELFWVTRKLVFKNTELYVIAETLSKAYDVEIAIADDNAKYCTWTITMEDLNIEEIMRLIEGSFNGLVVQKSNNKFTINGTCQ
ncbi:MAG: FecR domain-containing protein [Bacteroidales bacterium]|nr:FecR domain-containing protein [Bacteroidales bacterium]